jgi:hypothetical protein
MGLRALRLPEDGLLTELERARSEVRRLLDMMGA